MVTSLRAKGYAPGSPGLRNSSIRLFAGMAATSSSAKAEAAGKSFEERRQERREGDRERKRRQREKERADKAAAGTLRGRGRPTKTDGGEATP